MKNYYVKSYDSILEWQWYKDVNTCHLFRHLTQIANRKDKQIGEHTIRRGSTIRSLRTLADETGLTIQQIRTSLKKLEKTENLTRSKLGKYGLISITNYDEYQEFNTEVTRYQHDSNTEVTPKRERKKERKKDIIEDNYNNIHAREENLLGALEQKDRNGYCVPDWIPIDEWNAYLKMRVKIQKPATEEAKKIAVGLLQEYKKNGHDPVVVLKQSILNSWQGLFEPKGKHNGNQNGHSHNGHAADFTAVGELADQWYPTEHSG